MASLRRHFDRLGLRGYGGLLLDRLSAAPGMLGHVKHHAVGSAELGLEEHVLEALGPAHEAFGAERLELFDPVFQIVGDLDAKMVQADIVEPAAELVDVFEFEDCQVERAVAQVHAIADLLRIVAFLGARDFAEAEGLFIEFGGLVGIVGGEGDVADLRHESSRARWRGGDYSPPRQRTKSTIRPSAASEFDALGALVMNMCGSPANFASSAWPPTCR